jgi:desulfoferrodoxin (superoxide reductase-like protein)
MGITIKYTKETFIKKANEKHNNSYTYNLDGFENVKSKIQITCNIHGSWVTTGAPHLKGAGCPDCGRIKSKKQSIITKEKLHKLTFEEKANKIHANKYNYTLVVYKNTKTVIKIICSKHGIFEQKPSGHLAGQGCRECTLDAKRFTKEQFIEKANIAHKFKYDYSKVIYKNSNSYVDIVCPIHGIFNQKAYAHYKVGRGCSKCATERNGWTKTIFKEQCIKNNNRIRNFIYNSLF